RPGLVQDRARGGGEGGPGAGGEPPGVLGAARVELRRRGAEPEADRLLPGAQPARGEGPGGAGRRGGGEPRERVVDGRVGGARPRGGGAQRVAGEPRLGDEG